jgi:hypothetical protein
MPATKTKPDKLRAAHDKLQDAVAEITSDDDWQRMLKVASKFHRYSSGGIAYSNCVNSIGRPRALSCSAWSEWQEAPRRGDDKAALRLCANVTGSRGDS